MNGRWVHRGTGECILLDNRDSFTFNLAHRLYEAGLPCVVARSDELDIEELKSWEPSGIIVSPGPGHPQDAGVSMDAVREFSGSIPILGVCLGHQAIAEVFGAKVIANGRPRHGKSTFIDHNGAGLFDGLPQPLEVGRYHSLSIEGGMPDELVETASADGITMAIKHRDHKTYGVQFHPESVLTPQGLELLENFARLF